MTDIREARAQSAGSMELRSAESGDGYTLSGYASVYDVPYSVRDSLGEYQETIRAGAFTRSVGRADDVRLLLNHDGVPLARTKSGTLTLDSTDPHGLRVDARLDPSSPLVASVKSAMDRGDLDQMSFAFSAQRQKWSADYSQRDVLDATLFDVSVVTYPASEATSVALRGITGMTTEGRSACVLADALAQFRAAGVVDPVTRDLLLQVLGAIDSATEQIEDATEVLEDVLGVTPESDFDDIAEALEASEMMAPMRSRQWLNLQRAALDL